ncbi:hypothetical protein UlMin_031607 [Ulmus minor]
MEVAQYNSSCSSDYYGRAKEVEEFDKSKAGVKGLVDSGVVKIPRFFIIPPEILNKASNKGDVSLQVPVIDLSCVGESGQRRAEIVNDIREAAETWGFFQMVNHGVPKLVMEELLRSFRRFHEQPNEEKMKWYSQDMSNLVRFYSYGNYSSRPTPANWRDSLNCNFQDKPLDLEALPHVCKREIEEYMKCVVKLKDMVSELLSEALGLESDFLGSISCMKSRQIFSHYYPVCPEPEKTLGTTNHSDPNFLTILLQDNIGGLQVLYQDQWVDVPSIDGALVANIGDFMQIISNDKFKSVEHRVLAGNGRNVARLSAACFFYPGDTKKPYGPLQELVSEKNCSLYREVDFEGFMSHYRSKGLDGRSAIPNFKL